MGECLDKCTGQITRATCVNPATACTCGSCLHLLVLLPIVTLLIMGEMLILGVPGGPSGLVRACRLLMLRRGGCLCIAGRQQYDAKTGELLQVLPGV